MACIGLGVDVVGVEKFSRVVQKRGQRLIERLFTASERNHCDRRFRRLEAYSARFAAKEAFLKALGHGLRGGIRWVDIEISNDPLGKPKIQVSGKAKEVAERHGAKRCLLSLSHATGWAVAVVVLED